MARSKPLWRKGFDSVERAIGAPLESVVRSELYFDLVALSTRARNGAFSKVEQLSVGTLHLINLPAGTDIRKLREQIARMERSMAQLAKQIDDAARSETPPASDEQPGPEPDPIAAEDDDASLGEP